MIHYEDELAKSYKHSIIAVVYRGVEKLVSRQAHNLKITGSSPVPATSINKKGQKNCPF